MWIGHCRDIRMTKFRALALRWTKSYHSKRQFWNPFTHKPVDETEFSCNILLRLVFTSDGVELGVEVVTSLMTQSKSKLRSRKQSYKLDEIGVGRISTFLLSSYSVYNTDAYDSVQITSPELEAKTEKPTITKPRIEHCDLFILPLPLSTPTI